MAGQKFEYDESGSTFFYFLICFLGLVLAPSSFYYWWPDGTYEKPKRNREICQCEDCLQKEARLQKPGKWKGIKKKIVRFIIICGWVLLAYLFYKVQQFKPESANFDPYDILEVSIHSSQAEIKKSYRKLSLIYHPDKATGDERQFMKLTKAYQALTDDVARRNYELYGHPDGPGSMHLGIALPSWIIEKENSLWVLGLYGLVFMIGLPTVVAIWWYRSSKFSSDQVLLDTIQLYYFFLHKTPQLNFRRALMILAASLEFERGHNPDIVEYPSDNVEIPLLIKQLLNLGERNKERPLCFAYSIKARALLHAHLSRMKLPETTLKINKDYIVKCCPTLIHEMVTCVAQLIILAHTGRISKLPSLETVESIMKLSPCVVQAMWDSKNLLLQLPHITDDLLKHFPSKRKNIKTTVQLLTLQEEERRQLLKLLTEDEYNNVVKVCSKMPHVTMTINYEVVDDDDNGVFTAGAIVTVTVNLKRVFLSKYAEEQRDFLRAQEDIRAEDELKDSKNSGWRHIQKKGSKNRGKQAQVFRKKAQRHKFEDPKDKKSRKEEKRDEGLNKVEDLPDVSDSDESASHSDESAAGEADTESHKDEQKSGADDDAEWEKFQKGLTKREKALEGKSKMSHSVHCPHFAEDKQEYWWTYVCDRRKRMLITAPYLITNLVDFEEVQLKFTAPPKPGLYVYQVCLRSDSYLGLDQFQDIKLDVKEAREIITEHPQWDECSTDEDEDNEDVVQLAEDSEFATDDELTDDSNERW